MPVKLKKLPASGEGPRWGWRDLVIERRSWILPFVSVSYQLTRDGKKIESDFDTLREVRAFLAEEENQ